MIASTLLSAAALFVASTSAYFNGTITQSDQTIQDILSANESYSNFSQVFKNSKPLTPLFQEKGANYTVFAPSGEFVCAHLPFFAHW
jgi:hypothetical protein